MADHKEREHFIPLRKGELIDVLCSDGSLADAEREPFRQFCRMIEAAYHIEYHRRLVELKDAYAPFDPDADTKSIVKLSHDEKQRRLNDLFSDFAWLMERANFKHLSRTEVEPMVGRASDWGICMDVDFGVFERLGMFARGEGMKRRTRRRWRNLYRQEETDVEVFQRLVLILKLRPHKRLGKPVDTDHVFLKIFKEIPKLDLDMLLPGARVRMTYFDQGKISFPLISGTATALYNIADDVLMGILKVGANPLALWGVAAGALTYGTRSYFSYHGTKQRYYLNLTQSLYFQNLDSNAGVIHRLLDEAEEQECREAILGYYFLWRQAGEAGWTSEELERAIEQFLEQHAGVKVDFEIGDALNKLEKLCLVERTNDRYRARSIRQVLEQLDRTWHDHFRFGNRDSV